MVNISPLSAHHESSAAPPERYGDNHLSSRQPGERERLTSLAAALDVGSRARVDALRPTANWRCLDLGSGLGTMADYLARRCPEGETIAADIDLTFLADAALPANVTCQRFDALTDDYPDNSFDLIHARWLLTHLSSRRDVLRRMARWLTPGGWVIVEDLTDDLIRTSPNPLFRTVAYAMTELTRQRIGTDAHWSATFPEPFDAAGLVNTEVESHIIAVGKGQPANGLFLRGVEQFRNGLRANGVTDVQMDAFVTELSTCENPNAAFRTIRGWGHKPRH